MAARPTSLTRPGTRFSGISTTPIIARPTGVTSPAGAFGYDYDPSRLTLPNRITLPNTAFITNQYDLQARLTATYLKNSGGTNMDSSVYAYNTANQRTSVTRTDASTV